MAKVAVVKIEYEDLPHKIPATRIREDRGKLLIFDGDEKVGEFSVDKIEYWTLKEEEKF
ncbi:MAG: hypothetical protein WAN12_03695 [Candidatus Acidiferrum sp.]